MKFHKFIIITLVFCFSLNGLTHRSWAELEQTTSLSQSIQPERQIQDHPELSCPAYPVPEPRTDFFLQSPLSNAEVYGSQLKADPEPIAGDTNQDGMVDMVDFAVLKEAFGKENVIQEGADLNHDQRVNLLDYGILKLYFLKAIADAERDDRLARIEAVNYAANRLTMSWEIVAQRDLSDQAYLGEIVRTIQTAFDWYRIRDAFLFSPTAREVFGITNAEHLALQEFFERLLIVADETQSSELQAETPLWLFAEGVDTLTKPLQFSFLLDAYRDEAVEERSEDLFTQHAFIELIIAAIKRNQQTRMKTIIHDLLETSVLSRSIEESEVVWGLRKHYILELWDNYQIYVNYLSDTEWPKSETEWNDHIFSLHRVLFMLEGDFLPSMQNYLNTISFVRDLEKICNENAAACTFSQGGIIFQDNWRESYDIRMISHEFAHILHYLHPSIREMWLESYQSLFTASQTETDFISDYAETSPREDFAEMVGYWLTDSKLVLEKALQNVGDDGVTGLLLLEKVLFLDRVLFDHPETKLIAFVSDTDGSIQQGTVQILRNANQRIIRFDHEVGAIKYSHLEYDANGRLARVRFELR